MKSFFFDFKILIYTIVSLIYINLNMTNDLFNFRDYVLFLKDKLDNTDLSQVVWVHWDYWAWKTTTMNIIKELYQEDNLLYDNILEFSAWRNYYNKEDTVWKALLYELAGKIYDVFDTENINFDWLNDVEILKYINSEDIKKEKWYHKLNLFWTKEKPKDIFINFIQNTSKEIQYNLYQDLKDFEWNLENWKSEAEKYPYIAVLQCISWLFEAIEWKTSSIVELWKLLKKEEQELKKPKIDSLEVIQRKFDILLSFYNLIWEENKKPLIIMVDDLDRILPEKSVEIIEILRIFFEKSQKIHFICAIDLRVIEKWIERKFNQLNKWWDLSRIEFEEYLEKIITIPFDLPAIPLVDFDSSNNIFWIDTLIDNKFNENYKVNKTEITSIENIIKNFLINKLNKKDILEIELYFEDNINNKIINIIILDYLNIEKNINLEEFLKEYYYNKDNLTDDNKNIYNKGEIDIFKKYNIDLLNVSYENKTIILNIKNNNSKINIELKDLESKIDQCKISNYLLEKQFEILEKIFSIFSNEINTIDWLTNLEKFNNFKNLLIKQYNPLEYLFNRIEEINLSELELDELFKIDFSINWNIYKKIKEYSLLKDVNNYYIKNIENINTITFKNIITTWLQANPRKIKRFIDVFEIYFKILMYRLFQNIDFKKADNETLVKQYLEFSQLLSKMLIVKLEWDEIYKEFSKDKFYISFLESIVDKIKWKNETDFNISYSLENIIKRSKSYKLPNLLSMLTIWFSFNQYNNDEKKSYDLSKIMSNIYSTYYLIPNIDIDRINENEKFENIWEFNLLKYLYNNDELKLDYYISLDVIQDKNNILNLLNSYLKLKKTDNVQKVEILNPNFNKNVK